MKIIKLLLLIIMILFKTGNVLSTESLFTVNNIKIDVNSYKNKDGLINLAFKKGFEKLNKRILLREDYQKVENTNIRRIKNLVSHYQIIKNDLNQNLQFISVNVFFKRDKMYEFYNEKNIKYSDISDKNLEILPILIKDNETLIYEKNYFYKNWNKKSQENKDDLEIIEYLLPIESIEIIEEIEKNFRNLETLNLKRIFDDEEKDHLFIVINYKEIETKIFIKGAISSKKVVKNLSFKTEKIDYEKISTFLKKEILELIKKQNIVDIGTPSFLNINLKIAKQNDLFLFQNILNQIDLIENFHVTEFNNRFASVKIKYYGKTNILKEKLEKKKLILSLNNNKWSVRID